MIDVPISFRVTSLALEQSYDCLSACEVTLKDIGKIPPKSAYNRYSKCTTMCMIIGIYHRFIHTVQMQLMRCTPKLFFNVKMHLDNSVTGFCEPLVPAKLKRCGRPLWIFTMLKKSEVKSLIIWYGPWSRHALLNGLGASHIAKEIDHWCKGGKMDRRYTIECDYDITISC